MKKNKIQQNQEKEEKEIFESFKRVYDDFPSGIIKKSESPDYIISTANKKIGVEIAQLFKDNFLNDSLNLKRIENMRKRLGDLLCKGLEEVLDFTFILDIDFNDVDIKKKELDDIANSITDYFKKIKLPSFNEDGFIVLYNSEEVLPLVINSISIFKQSLEESEYVESAACPLPNLTIDHLQAILDKKEKLLHYYYQNQKCNEYWLLLFEGSWESDSFNSVDIDKLETVFDKVFIYRRSQDRVKVIK